MLEDHTLVRKLNEIEFMMRKILDRLPEEETVEEMVERILKDRQNNA